MNTYSSIVSDETFKKWDDALKCVQAFESAAKRLKVPQTELVEALQDGGIAELIEVLKEYQRIIPAIRHCNELVALVIAENYVKCGTILAKIEKVETDINQK